MLHNWNYCQIEFVFDIGMYVCVFVRMCEWLCVSVWVCTFSVVATKSSFTTGEFVRLKSMQVRSSTQVSSEYMGNKLSKN